MPPINSITSATGLQQVLVVDPSATHLAYLLMSIDFDKLTANISNVGMLWVNAKYNRGQRFSYMRKAIQVLLNTTPPPNAVFTEAFFVNPKMMMGSAVVPVINGIIELSCVEVAGPNLQFTEISPPAWRAILGIKPDMTVDPSGRKKRDYKEPTKRKVEQQLGLLPEQVISNVTGKFRDTPHDISDVLAIGLAILKQHGIEKIGYSAEPFTNTSILERLKGL